MKHNNKRMWPKKKIYDKKKEKGLKRKEIKSMKKR